MTQKSHYHASNNEGNEDRKRKRANQDSGGHLTHKGPCKTVPVQEKIYRRWIALHHGLKTGHDDVTVLCYEQIQRLQTTYSIVGHYTRGGQACTQP